MLTLVIVMAVTYKPFDDLEREVQTKRGERYRKNQIDFDNSSIVNSASRVLKSLNIHNFVTLMVGPDKVGNNFSLANQLEEKNIDFYKAEPRYVFFSLPTKLGEHSVAIVIDRKNKQVHIMDSLGEDYTEAKKQISQCVEQGILDGYEITSASGVQQKDKLSCGVHSSANIIEVVSGAIVPFDGHQLPDRSEEEVIRLTGLLSTANDDEAAERQKKEKESVIAYRQKQSLRTVLELIKPQSADIRVFLTALKKEIPPGSEFEQRNLADFLVDFGKKFPANKLNPLFKKSEFASLLKKYPPLDLKLSKLLEEGMADFFHKKTPFEKLKDLLTRIPSPSSGSKETKAHKIARKQIEKEIETAHQNNGGEEDRQRIKKLVEIAEECSKNGINHFDCLQAIKALAENKKAYMEMGYESIKHNLSQPRLLSINGIQLHIDPYAPLNHAYSHVSLANGLNGIIDAFLSQYERAKNADLLYEWSGNFLGYCLDGQLESAFNFLQVRDQPKMSLDAGMQVFLAEYAQDFAEEKFIRKIRTFSDLERLHGEYQLALAKVSQGETYQMILSDAKEKFSEKDVKILKWEISHLGVAFNPSRIAKFILEKHPDYVFSDGQELTEQLIKSYLATVLDYAEAPETRDSYSLLLTQLDTLSTNDEMTAVEPPLISSPLYSKEKPMPPKDPDEEKPIISNN